MGEANATLNFFLLLQDEKTNFFFVVKTELSVMFMAIKLR